jgi:hypothetical protein
LVDSREISRCHLSRERRATLKMDLVRSMKQHKGYYEVMSSTYLRDHCDWTELTLFSSAIPKETTNQIELKQVGAWIVSSIRRTRSSSSSGSSLLCEPLCPDGPLFRGNSSSQTGTAVHMWELVDTENHNLQRYLHEFDRTQCTVNERLFRIANQTLVV